MFKILVVEDDLDLKQLFIRTLEKNGYEATGARDALEALNILDQQHIDLIVTDVMMPGMDGFELIREIRQARMDMPVLFITAKGDIRDKQKGFRVGADDYMVKPIDIRELPLRVHALLRRAKSANDRILNIGGTVFSYDEMSVTNEKGTMILPQKEFRIIYKLLSYPGQIFTRQQILDDIWGENGYQDSHTLDVHISRLRERFRNNPDFRIVTIHGLGYKVVLNEGK